MEFSTRKDLGGLFVLLNPPERWEKAKGCPGFPKEEAAECLDGAERSNSWKRRYWESPNASKGCQEKEQHQDEKYWGVGRDWWEGQE